MRRIIPMLVILFIVIGIPAQALAFVPRGGGAVTISDAINDDVYAGGQSVTVTAQIDGDLVAAAQDVTVNAPVTGMVMAAGATVDLTERVGRSVRAAGNVITLGGPVGTDALLFGATVRVTDGAAIGRDLVAFGNRIRQAGSVGRDATLYGGRVTIAGTIQGNVRAEADEVVVLSSARITGRLTYSASQEATIEQGAQISGGVERTARPVRPQRVRPSRFYGFGLFGLFVEIVFLLVLGFVALAITTRGVRSVADRVTRRFGMSLLGGFVLAVVVPVAAILVCITLIGIPLGIVAMLLYLATLYPSMIFVAAALGDWILVRTRSAGATPPSPYLAMLIGVIVLGILMALPVVGWIIRALAIFAGFGALWAAVWEKRGTPAPAQAPPP